MNDIIKKLFEKEKEFITVINEDEKTSSELRNLLLNNGIIVDNKFNFYYETVYEEITSNLDKKNNEVLINDMINKFKIKDILKFDPNLLSYGQKQLIVFLKAFLTYETPIIMINSLTSIDNYTKEVIFKQLKKANRKIINITKDPEESVYGDRIILINDNSILLDGKTEEILDNEKIFKKANLKLPFFADLSIKLKYYDLIDKIILNKIKLVNKLWK